jgi:hypothetical protein
MKDEQIEDLLRRVRPIGPGPELRTRIAGARRLRTWPWAAAAAALLAVTVTVQFSTARTHGETARLVAPLDESASDLEALNAALGGDAMLLRQAQLWTAEQRRLSPDAEGRSR